MKYKHFDYSENKKEKSVPPMQIPGPALPETSLINPEESMVHIQERKGQIAGVHAYL